MPRASEPVASRHNPQLVAQATGGRHDRVVDHLQGNTPSCHCRLPADDEHAQCLDHAVTATKRDGALACEGGVRGILRVEIVVLAAFASVVLVGVSYRAEDVVWTLERGLPADRLSEDDPGRSGVRVHLPRPRPVGLCEKA